MGESGNSEVSNSQMDRRLRIGFRAVPAEPSSVGEGEEGRSRAAVALEEDGLGVGFAVWRGP